MDDLVYFKKPSPPEIKVHWKYCSYASSMMARPFNPEEWPPSDKYYIVGCNFCKPFEDKRKRS